MLFTAGSFPTMPAENLLCQRSAFLHLSSRGSATPQAN